MALFVFPLKSINGSNMYNNDDFRQYFANFISTGILANVPLAGSTAFQVTQTDTPSMNVSVGSGVAWIIGGQVMNTSPLSFKIPAPLTSQSRTDSIVVQWSNSSNNGDIIYKQNSTQVVQTNDVFELQLCKILVPANATNIPQANIIDTRADPSVCGFSSPYEAIKTGDLLAQFKSELEANGIVFSDWFEHIKGQLSEDAAGNLQNQIDSLDSKVYTAYANSADGTDGFTTVYPNLNLIEDGKFAKPISSKWNTDGTTISKDDITGYFKVKFNGAGSLNRTYYTAGISTIPIGQKYSVYIKAYSLESSLNIKMGSTNGSQDVTVTNNSNIPKTYKVEGLVRGASDTFGIFGGLTTTLGTLFISEIKLEQGPTTTPWMPSSSEVTTADYPQYKYVGRMTGLNVADKNDPKNYKWQINTDVVRDESWNIVERTISIPYTWEYGLTGTLRRTGNVVEWIINRNVVSGSNPHEQSAGAAIPAGFRPIERAYVTVDLTNGNGFVPWAVARIDSNGNTYLTNNRSTAPASAQAFGTWITNDPWPEV